MPNPIPYEKPASGEPVVLTFQRPPREDGTPYPPKVDGSPGDVDQYELPAIGDLDAALISEMADFSTDFWMARVLSRYQPQLARRLSRSQMSAVASMYFGEKETATPGESTGSSPSSETGTSERPSNTI